MNMYYPAQIASNYIKTGQTKAALPTGKALMLSIMAGIFVAMAAAGANTMVGAFENPGLGRVGAACIFPTALAMVLFAGSELFTGNSLMVIPLYEKQITAKAMIRNWCLVYLGNFIGSLLVVMLLQATGQWAAFSGAVATVTIKTAATKLSYSFGKCILMGIGCNFLVCIAVWMAYAADSVGGKLAALFLPIALFVVVGFEHSVANMYYIPAGLLAAGNAVWAEAALNAGVHMETLSVSQFLFGNLLPVTIGNLIGGTMCVATPYWYIYIRGTAKEQQQKPGKAA